MKSANQRWLEVFALALLVFSTVAAAGRIESTAGACQCKAICWNGIDSQGDEEVQCGCTSATCAAADEGADPADCLPKESEVPDRFWCKCDFPGGAAIDPNCPCLSGWRESVNSDDPRHCINKECAATCWLGDKDAILALPPDDETVAIDACTCATANPWP